MAMIKCRECGKDCASSAKTCPHCGVATPNGTTSAASIIIKLLIAVLLFYGIYSCTKSMNENSSAPPSSVANSIDALTTCQLAIERVATNPSSAHVPYAKDYGSQGEHYFAWPKGSGLTMMNGFGAHIDTSASCTTDANGKITSLSVGGKTIL